MYNFKNRYFIGLLGIFFLWPFGALLIALNKFHRIESKKIVYIFIILFGLTFVLGNKKLDSFRYAEYFIFIANLSFKDFMSFMSSAFMTQDNLDLAKPIISFIISRISNDYRLFFGTIAAIFGYYYIKSINITHQLYRQNKSYLSLFFLLYFAIIINPIFHINGFRFWTASWVFFLGAYRLITLEKKKYLLLTFFSVFFHFSFIVPNLILLLYLILGNRNKLYFIFLIASFFISDFIFQMFPQFVSYFGEGIAEKSARYANVDRMQQVADHAEWAKEQGKWYLYLPGRLTFYYITLTFFYINYKYKKHSKTTEFKNLFSFSLLFLAFGNTVSFIPSMGRFRTLFLLFGLSYIIGALSISRFKKKNWLLLIGLIPFSLNLIVVLRLGVDVLNPWLFTLLPFPFVFDETSIYQWLFN